MRRLAALLWLIVVLAAGGHLAARVHAGLGFRTDLLALLPREEQDPVLQRANDMVSKALGRRLMLLVGAADRTTARAAAERLGADLMATGAVESVGAGIDTDRVKRLGALYFPYRNGLLSDADRALLAAGRGAAIAQRALAQAFGFAGMADAGMLRSDPFLLLPSFLTGLPFPLSRLTPDDGLLSVTEKDVTWFLVSATLKGEPFELALQNRLVGAVDSSVGALTAAAPGLRVMRLGAVFFAHSGSRTAIGEASTLSVLALAGTILLVLLVFRRAAPLLHNVLALGVGVGVGLSGSLLLFGELHVAALLFGTSLIGVSVDYGLHYSACLFDPATPTGRDRLAHVLPGIALGLVTTVIGYAVLTLAPFPGLRQIAAFSTIGLVAAFLTVALWLPLLDRATTVRHGAGMLRAAGRLWRFWEEARWRRARMALLLVCAAVVAIGLLRLTADDDVRHLQALSPELKRQQDAIQRLIGATNAAQFLLVRAADDEAALRREEALAPVLARLAARGAIAGSLTPAAFVPSAQRQRDNRALVASALNGPLLAAQRAHLGLPPVEPEKADPVGDVLTLRQVLAVDAVPFLSGLVLGPGLHAVALQGLTDPDTVRAAMVGMPDVRLVDPTADFSALLGKYRRRALLLSAMSALLMLPVLVWRYGPRGAAWVLLPPAAALAMAPAVIGLTGQGFTFFHAMALVLILSIGVDYAVFCAESGRARRPVTMLAVWLATLTTLLSFGLLAASRVPAVHSFGVTMLVGISIAFFFSPLAGRGARDSAATMDA